ncbi:MAG TPA: protein phosphatase 2C domain-containing protein, partial [Gemmatimonadota bacterium]|nr:protein phosphatase 2C domain-containing protein [Gemmatimonadota bacterium]
PDSGDPLPPLLRAGGEVMAAVDSDATASGERKPRHSDIDAWGLTHPGLVRQENEDHFFLGSLSRSVQVDATSISADPGSVVEPERLASFAMVADGVGQGGGGEEASRAAVQALVQHVSTGFHEAYLAESSDTQAFPRLLEGAALACHESLQERSDEEQGARGFATTLTLFLGLWPHAYVLHVGDSRCYVFQDGELTQISRDQTMAQDLVDAGVLTQQKAQATKWAHVLSSAIGGQEAEPVVSRIVRQWGTVVLLCSDGLTKHVSDERIAERLASLISARQTCEDLLQDALADGGTDNITIIIGRTVKPSDAGTGE